MQGMDERVDRSFVGIDDGQRDVGDGQKDIGRMNGWREGVWGWIEAWMNKEVYGMDGEGDAEGLIKE